jgi:hypothetical protein
MQIFAYKQIKTLKVFLIRKKITDRPIKKNCLLSEISHEKSLVFVQIYLETFSLSEFFRIFFTKE